MQVFVTEPPAGSPPALLQGRFSPAHGTFALVIGPAEKIRSKRTRKTVSIPFFHCLRKNLKTVGSYTAMTSEFRAQISHWFAAYDTHDLVVFNAHVLYPATMQALFEYAQTVPRITFACDPGNYELTRAAVHAAGVSTQSLPWDELVARLPVAPLPTVEPDPAYGMEHLPTSDFLLFRHQARLLNTPERFGAIDTDYRTAYDEALTVNPDLDSVVAMIARVTRSATITAPIMVALRATQAALLTRGYYLGAHQDKALGTLCAVRSPNPTNAHWRALHGYTRTARAAGVALYLLDVPPDDLRTVTVGAVRDSLAAGRIGTQPIPDLARPLLKAHLHFRDTEGAIDTDPYLNIKGARRHLEDLVDARRHLGLPVDARYLRNGRIPHTERPIWRFGLELRSLT